MLACGSIHDHSLRCNLLRRELLFVGLLHRAILNWLEASSCLVHLRQILLLFISIVTLHLIIVRNYHRDLVAALSLVIACSQLRLPLLPGHPLLDRCDLVA